MFSYSLKLWVISEGSEIWLNYNAGSGEVRKSSPFFPRPSGSTKGCNAKSIILPSVYGFGSFFDIGVMQSFPAQAAAVDRYVSHYLRPLTKLPGIKWTGETRPFHPPRPYRGRQLFERPNCLNCLCGVELLCQITVSLFLTKLRIPNPAW